MPRLGLRSSSHSSPRLFYSNAGSTTPTQNPCTAGNYCPQGSSTPLSCPSGNFCPAGAGSPTPCGYGANVFCPHLPTSMCPTLAALSQLSLTLEPGFSALLEPHPRRNAPLDPTAPLRPVARCPVVLGVGATSASRHPRAQAPATRASIALLEVQVRGLTPAALLVSTALLLHLLYNRVLL
jgi:hypothetical protein